MFSIIIPTFNNLKYLKLWLNNFDMLFFQYALSILFYVYYTVLFRPNAASCSVASAAYAALTPRRGGAYEATPRSMMSRC